MLIESADFNNGSGLIDMNGRPSGMYIAKSEGYSQKILIIKYSEKPGHCPGFLMHGGFMKRIFLILFSMVIILASCSEQPYPDLDRENYIPADKVKLTPADDNFIPVMMSDEWNDPVPLEGTVNTAGAEDSPFITDDGRFFFFFTPDAQIPAEQQLTDSVTGIWWCTVDNGVWTEPKRIMLNNDVALDGCSFVQGDTLWFGSVRAGNLGELDI